MKRFVAGRGAFIRLLSGAVAAQALLSGSNFIVGFMFVRRTPDAQYGYYVLITTAVLLATMLQNTFTQMPMIIRLTGADAAGRADLVGGLSRDLGRLVPYMVILAAVVVVVLGLTGRLGFGQVAVLLCGAAAVIATLRREFIRTVLFAYRRPHDVVRSDASYCVLLVAGAYVATLSPLPAATAGLTMAVSSVVGWCFLSRSLWRHEPWNRRAPAGMLREIAPQGAWSALGGSIHWLFSQGYNYLVAGILGVTAVAALAATRLLVMPVILLSTGIGTLMLPTASTWATHHGGATVLRRLGLFAIGLAALSSCYFLAIWLGRDWIFSHVLKKNFAHRDLLLLTWFAVALVMIFRDQLLYFLVTRARFQLMSWVTLVSCILSFAISYTAMRRIGVIGALLGLFAGELCNVIGIIFFSFRELRRSVEQPMAAPNRMMRVP